MCQKSFWVDDATLKAILELKVAFGVKTASQVIRKALALARVCADNLDEDGNVTFVKADGENLLILMRS